MFSGEGAARYPGRWNAIDQRMIYASLCYATSLVEKLVHSSEMPPDQHFVTITIPAGASYEELNEAKTPGWHEANGGTARSFGSRWFDERRSLILFVPSVVARLDRNVLINCDHPDFSTVRHSREVPIWWDERLFAR